MLRRAFVAAAWLVCLAALVPAHAEAAPAPIQWCGNDVAQSDRIPEHVGGRQIHVVYAIPSDGTDRFGTLSSQIATDLLAVDEWWRREDPARAPRFDLFPFPACPTKLGLLDLSFARLPHPTSRYLGVDSRLAFLANDLAAPPFGFADPHKKYLVYYDGPVEEPDVCGTSVSSLPHSGGPFAYAAVWLAACPGDVGTGRFQAVVAAHELIHNLGALPHVQTGAPGPPNACAGDPGHPCDDPLDILYPSGTDASILDAVRLDVGRNDYYGHSGTWWDVQDSTWLSHLDVGLLPLDVSVRGSDQPRLVASDLPGIACPPGCSISWDRGTAVSLQAAPTAGELEFAGWSGSCSGLAPTCSVAMDAAKAAVATYRPRLRRLAVTVKGKGRVTSAPAGIACARSCSAEFRTGTTVRLRATPAKGWRFSSWRGSGCTGKVPRCGVPLFSNASATATFTKIPRPKRKS